jgi:hypothetical protein
VRAENRLTAEQLAALSPGDAVTIESGQDFGRRRYATGRIVRVDAGCITNSVRGRPRRHVRGAAQPSRRAAPEWRDAG